MRQKAAGTLSFFMASLFFIWILKAIENLFCKLYDKSYEDFNKRMIQFLI